ncbi:hypothetical protein [Nocardia sp. alder85J]|uniref:hypothetical protein n=1 Tax=Nocardia sp. alder85J TaxID=2862949 RepID=UPI001CD19820|nr:hypothetical protein [Nocardia sp. alder85J]MCX4093066.1 hypothetical protein [Nocardia sp. alder85J]
MTSSDGEAPRATPIDTDVPFLLGELGIDPLMGELVAESVAEQLVSAEPPDIVAADPGAAERAARIRELEARIGRELTALGPAGWTRLEAVFALTVAAEAGYVGFLDDQDRVARVEPPETTLAAVREHRLLSAPDGDGPWWRLLIAAQAGGDTELVPDDGAEPFPDDQLFDPEAYLEDLHVFPRRRLPLWLAAYLWHEGRQVRTPRQAAEAARAARAVPAPVAGVPELPALWGRWTVIAAAFLAIGSPRGPGVAPALAWFEDGFHSGSSLFLLPGGRAVLSGGVATDPDLDAAYNTGGPLPDLYAGAPAWVADPVLDPRSRAGLLSFCLWWSGGQWYRGGPGGDPAAALPPVSGPAETVSAIVELLAAEATPPRPEAVRALVGAAETNRVGRADLAAVFTAPEHDLDSAYYQLIIAGVAAE